MKTHVKFACLGLLAASLTLSGCGGGEEGTGEGGTSGGGSAYASPDKVFDAFKAAATRNDLKQFMGCMSAKSRNEFALGMFMFSALLPMQHMDDVAKAEALAKEIESVMAKHGLSEQKLDEIDFTAELDYDKVFAPVKDKAAFLADLFDIMAREDSDTPLKMLASASLKDVKLDGEKATGKMVVDGDEKEIEFVKVDGSWLIEMPSPGGRDASIAESEPKVKASAPGTAMGDGRPFKAGWSIALWDEEDSELVVVFLEAEPTTDMLKEMTENQHFPNEFRPFDVPMIMFQVEFEEKNGAPDVASPKSWRVSFDDFGDNGPVTLSYNIEIPGQVVEVSGNPQGGGQVKGRFTGTQKFVMDNTDYSWNLSFDLPVH